MIFTLALLALSTFAAHAVVSVSLPGSTESSSWELNNRNYPGYNEFGTAANPWPAPAAPSSGTSSALFDKTGGSGYTSFTFMYTAGNTGSFSIYDDSPITDLATIVFQGAISDPLAQAPVLNYNGGAQALVADSYGVYPGSSYPDRAWQWDLSGIGDAITDYEITFGGHFAATSLSLDTGDSFVQVVPEASTSMLAALAGLAFAARRRRN